MQYWCVYEYRHRSGQKPVRSLVSPGHATKEAAEDYVRRIYSAKDGRTLRFEIVNEGSAD